MTYEKRLTELVRNSDKKKRHLLRRREYTEKYTSESTPPTDTASGETVCNNRIPVEMTLKEMFCWQTLRDRALEHTYQMQGTPPPGCSTHTVRPPTSSFVLPTRSYASVLVGRHHTCPALPHLARQSVHHFHTNPDANTCANVGGDTKHLKPPPPPPPPPPQLQLQLGGECCEETYDDVVSIDLNSDTNSDDISDIDSDSDSEYEVMYDAVDICTEEYYVVGN